MAAGIRRRLTAAAAGRLARSAGLVTVPAGIYCPVPEQLPPGDDPHWLRRAPLHGFELDLDRQLEFIEARLADPLAEFDEELRTAEPGGFDLRNSQYPVGDAELLYAMVRSQRPSRLLEIGSGYSTLVAAAACARNAREGSPVEMVAVDPEPRTQIVDRLEGLARWERTDCRDLPSERFRELGPGDMLFIDSSHIAKLGSEVNMLILEVLPALADGVLVHLHDIYLPYEYHPLLYAFGGYFNEQYLLHAMLTENPNWEVLVAAAALARGRSAELRRLLPNLSGDLPRLHQLEYVPSSFWLRRSSAESGGGP